MATTSKAKSALPYVQRLLEDKYVQDQLRDATVGVRSTYRRAVRRRGQATDDKKLYRSLRRAATSIRNATIALRRPEPPPKRRGRKMLVIALCAGGTALLAILVQKQQSGISSRVASSEDGGVPGSAPVQQESAVAPS
jgi:hypothetical protein